MSRIRVLGLCAMMGLSLARHVVAQEAPATSNIGPDVVRLKNGGLIRGTITELVPGESVTIVGSVGKTHQLQMSDVEYAGPANKDPAATSVPPAPVPARAVAPTAPARVESSDEKVQPYVTVQAPRATVHLESNPPGLTFHRAASSAIAAGPGGMAVGVGYDRLCTAPCDVNIPAGTERLTVSKPDSIVFGGSEVTIPAGKSRLVGSFESHSGLRAAGWVVLLGSAALGGALFYASFGSHQECSGFGEFRSCYKSTDVSVPLATASTLIAAAGIPIGIVMVLQPDQPKVELGARQQPLPIARGLSLISAF